MVQVSVGCLFALVAKWLIHSILLKILGAKGAEEYAERIDRQCVTDQWGGRVRNHAGH